MSISDLTSGIPDVTSALAKMTETVLGSAEKLDTPAKLGQLLATIFYIDRTAGGGFLNVQATQLVREIMTGMESYFGIPVGHDPMYVWYLATRYGKMCSEATTPSKADLIYHAFFSEFSKEYANDADTALFRDIVEKVDYNEALFLGGLSALTKDNSYKPDAGTVIKFTHNDYHVVKSLMRKGDICIISIHDDSKSGSVNVRATPALSRFANFVKMNCAPLNFA